MAVSFFGDMSVFDFEIRRLEDEMNQIRQQNQVNNVTLTEKEKEIKKLKDEMNQIRQQNQVNNATLTEKEKKIKKLEDEMNQIRQQNQVNNATLTEKEIEMKLLKYGKSHPTEYKEMVQKVKEEMGLCVDAPQEDNYLEKIYRKGVIKILDSQQPNWKDDY
ncbi:hypothetical protein QTN25_004812 [Entamoeba marina]